jgi:(1->4)-alpha-D-glucan 1-alpha-D-glucosylmutase
VFWFEREGQGDFKSPQHWMEQALATVSTHDLPTLAGFWHGDDIAERIALNLFPSEALRDQVTQQRIQDRARLLAALAREGLLEEGDSTDPAAWPVLTPGLIRAVHAYVARTACQVMMFQLEDFTAMHTQVNLPGTNHERANWRLRLPKTVAELATDAGLLDAMRSMALERERNQTVF